MQDSPLRTSIRIPILVACAAALGVAGVSWLNQAPSALDPQALHYEQAVTQQTNQFTKSRQDQAALDASPDGDWLTVWTSRRQQQGHYAVLARAYDADGIATSGEVPVNEFASGVQDRPSVAWIDNNSAWVTWQATGIDGSGTSVLARRINRSAQPIGPETQVNETTDGDQGQPVVVTNADESTLVAWTHHDIQLERTEVRARSWQNDTWSEEVTVSSAESTRDTVPTATALDDGRFLIAWSRKGTESAELGIYARFLTPTGKPLGNELLLSEARAGEIEPSVVATRHGFEVAWLSQDGSGYDVRKRSFDTHGKPLTSIETVARGATGWKSGVSVTSMPNNQVLVSFNDDRNQRTNDVRGQLYDGDGAAKYAEPVPLVAGDGSQELTAASGAQRVAVSNDGHLAIAWSGSGTGDSSGAHWSLFGSDHTATPLSGAEPPSDLTLLGARPPFRSPNYVPRERNVTLGGAGGDFGFIGIANTGLTPPDPEIAVGPDGIVLMVNAEISGYSFSGIRLWQTTQLDFWGDLGASGLVFDPEIAWDPHNDRIWAMAAEQASNNRDYFLLAVSKTSNPVDEDDWWKFRIDVTDIAGAGGFTDFIDSPNLALNKDFILLTADFFTPGDEYLIVVLDKMPLLDGDLDGIAFELFDGTQGSSPHSMGIPVVHSDDTSILYILQSTEFGTNDEVIVHAISDPLTNYNRVTTSVSVPNYTFPSPPPQKDTSSRPTLFEPRFWSVAERNGSLWAVHHVSSDRVRVRWYEIDLGNWPDSGTPTLAQQGEIDLGDGLHTFFPSIEVDEQENAAISFARSATNEYISYGRVLRAAGDPPNTFRPMQVVQTSQNESTAGRWGDYSGTQAHPGIAGSFWGHHEFTASDPNDWDTWVANYQLREEIFVLSADPLVAGASVTFRVSGATPGETVAFAASTEGTGLTERPAFDLTFSLENARLLGTATADSLGNAEFTVTIPNGTEGTEVIVQAGQRGLTTNWVIDTVS